MISYAISRLETNRLSAEIRIRPEFKPRPALSETLDIPAFGQLLGNLPAAMVMLPLDITRDLLAQAPTSTGSHVARQALRADVLSARDDSLVMALLTGDYGGGFGKEPWRVKIPALMLFLKLRTPEESTFLITGVLDNLNAHYRLGLIIDPAARAVGKFTVHTLEATRPNLMASLAMEDRPAYAVVGPWIMLSSNTQSLITLLERYQNAAALPDASPGRWRTVLDKSKACAFLWMDLDVCGRALPLPLTALAMSRRASPSASAFDSGDMLKTLKTWLEDVRPMKTGALWMNSGAPSGVLRLEIGE